MIILPYAATLRRTLAAIVEGAPRARIFVVGAWTSARSYASAIRTLPHARDNHTGGGPCDLFDASGRARPAGIASKDRIVRGYERQIARVCARFRTCRHDRGALRRLALRRADLANENHLSVRGLRKMAARRLGRAVSAPIASLRARGPHRPSADEEGRVPPPVRSRWRYDCYIHT